MDARTPVDAFDVLAEETRWDIVTELAAHRRDNWQPRGLAFADLRRAVGVDDAGRFNYHLEQLVGQFVNKADGEYILTNEGLSLVGDVLAGAYDTAERTRSERTDHSCPQCARTLSAIYELGYLRLECPSHGVLTGAVIPKRPALERPIEDVLALAGRRVRSQLADSRAGICPHCRGPTDSSLASVAPTYPHRSMSETADSRAYVAFDCVECGFHVGWPASIVVATEPATVAFRHDHDDPRSGIPLLESSLSTVHSARLSERADGSSELPSDAAARFDRAPAVDLPDGAAAVVELAAPDESLLCWLDETAMTVDTHRVSRP